MGEPNSHLISPSCDPRTAGSGAASLGMSFSDYEDEFRELCEHAEADLAALQRGGAPDTRGVLQQVESDLREAAAQIKNMEVSASDHSSRTKAASLIQGHHSTLARLRTDLDRASREMHSAPASSSQNRQSLFSYPQTGYGASDPNDLENGQQMERLLSTRAKQEETSRRLEETLRICGESESVGAGVLENLHGQRASILSSMDKVGQADDDLSRSGQVLKLLERSIMFDGVLKAVAWVLLGLLVVFILYYIATR